MTLRYQIFSTDNPDYNPDLLKTKAKDILQFKKCLGLLTYTQSTEVSKLRNRLNDIIKSSRSNLNDLQNEEKIIKFLKIKSTKNWTFYPEEIDADFGITKYSKPENISVDVSVPYTKNNTLIPFRDIVNQAKDKALEKIRRYRKERKQIQHETRVFDIVGLPESPTYTVYAGGGFSGERRQVTYRDPLRGTEFTYETAEVTNNFYIHYEPNTFLELQNSAKLKKIFDKKKPLNSSNHVGVEIEFASKLTKIELARKLLKKGLESYVCLVEDGSIRPVDEYKYAHELTVIAPEQIIHSVLKDVLAVINEDNASRVGGRCGLHVHLDMRNRDKRLAYNNLLKAQRMLYAMNPRSRLDGTTATGNKDTVWSKKVEWQDFDAAWNKVHNVGDSARYYGINVLALERHGTIEIRIHSGSTNFEKISNWVTILTSIVNLEEKIEVEATKPETFCRYYKLDNNILEYVKLRVAKFKDKDGKHITIDEVA